MGTYEESNETTSSQVEVSEVEEVKSLIVPDSRPTARSSLITNKHIASGGGAKEGKGGGSQHVPLQHRSGNKNREREDSPVTLHQRRIKIATGHPLLKLDRLRHLPHRRLPHIRPPPNLHRLIPRRSRKHHLSSLPPLSLSRPDRRKAHIPNDPRMRLRVERQRPILLSFFLPLIDPPSSIPPNGHNEPIVAREGNLRDGEGVASQGVEERFPGLCGVETDDGVEGGGGFAGGCDEGGVVRGGEGVQLGDEGKRMSKRRRGRLTYEADRVERGQVVAWTDLVPMPIQLLQLWPQGRRRQRVLRRRTRHHLTD